MPVDLDEPAHDVRVGGEVVLPKRFADDRDWMRIRRAVVIVGEQAAVTGAHAEQREVIPADDFPLEPAGIGGTARR